MAQTNLQIIKTAMLSIGAIAIRAVPAAHDLDVCLDRLSSLIRTLPGWTEWNNIEINQDYTAGDDERIAVIGDVTVTVTLPQLNFYQPVITYESDGFTVKTGDYYVAPRDGARVAVYAQQGDDNVYYAYRADTGHWIQVHNLEPTGIVPLDAAMHMHLEAMLAVSIAPLYGLPVSQELGMAYDTAQRAMTARYSGRFQPKTPADDFNDIARWF